LEPVKIGVQAAAVHVKGKAAIAPRVSRRPQPFVSDRQRRGFFYHLKMGDIVVPWRRAISKGSQDLEHSWWIKTRDRGLAAVVGNDTTYGPLVQAAKDTGHGKQAQYHKIAGWKTDETILAENQDAIKRIIQQEIEKELRR